MKGIKTVDGGRGAVVARPQAEVLSKFVTCSGLLIAMYTDTTVGPSISEFIANSFKLCLK